MTRESEDSQTEMEAPRVSSLDLDGEGEPGGLAARMWRAPRRWRWALQLGGAVAALALLGALISALAPLLPKSLLQAPAPSAPAILALDLSPDLSDCAATGYWSPDSRLIAVLKLSQVCGVTTRQPDVYVYDATSGAQTTTYHVTAAIQAALTGAGAGDWWIAFDGLSWAPNQRTIAAFWHATRPPDQGDSLDQLTGLALITLTGAHAGAVTILLDDGGPGDPGPTGPSGMLILPGRVFERQWDVEQGGLGASTIEAGQDYAWTPDDQVAVLRSFAGGAPTAVPRGGQAFTAWREGLLSVADTAECQGQGAVGPPAPFALLTLNVNEWSPDGRYLLSFADQARVVDVPAVNGIYNAHDCFTAAQASALSVAPIHDRAMRAALGLLGQIGSEQVALLWSPDGKRMAAIPSSAKRPPLAALVFNTTTGALITRIAAGSSQIPSAQGSDADATISGAAWSPDGKRLLVGVSGLQFAIRVYSGHALG